MSDQYEFDLDVKTEAEVVEANEIVWSATLDWIKKYDSMVIAANMLNSALRIYKTEMSDEDYKMFCATLYDMTDLVQPMHSGKKH
tara:strand:+ start:115 stop:369 length:255 start_codon:yes stop_codon:yes gene_type:complete